MKALKIGIIKHLQENYQIPREAAERMYNDGLLSEKNCRDILVKKEYQQNAKPRQKEGLKVQLGEKYNISVKLVEKAVYS